VNPSFKAVISVWIVWLDDITNSTRHDDVVPLVRMSEDASI
jgi:hypothetical protein